MSLAHRAPTLARILCNPSLTPRWHGLLTLNYHRTRNPGDFAFDTTQVSATVEELAAQLRALKSRVELISANDVELALSSGSGRYAMITFDDGYRDNFDNALPVLAAEGVPATFFISTGLLDRGALPWWDQIGWMVQQSAPALVPPNAWLPEGFRIQRENMAMAIHVLSTRYKLVPTGEKDAYLAALSEATGVPLCSDPPAEAGWMTWEMVRSLEAAGMHIGGHTVNHPELSRLTAADQEAEIEGCQRRLTEELGHPVTAFAYPHGSRDAYDLQTMRALRAHGFTHAFTFFGGYSHSRRTDRLQIPRVGIGLGTTAEDVASLASLPQLYSMTRWSLQADLGNGWRHLRRR